MTVEPRDQSEIRADVIRRYAVTSFERWMEVVERLANDTPSLLDALSAALAAKEAAEARAGADAAVIINADTAKWVVANNLLRERAEQAEAQVRAVRAQRDEWERNGEVGQCVLADIDAALAAAAPSEPQEPTP